MPYKHIASHLKKTELACRLHYHQLSHGSNRRKRTASVTSSSQSPVLTHMTTSRLPSPINEHMASASVSPAPYSSYSPMPQHSQIQLPAILNRPSSASPQRSLGPTPSLPIAILPKPSAPAPFSHATTRSLDLRLNCAIPTPNTSFNPQLQQPQQQQPSIDRSRLAQIYSSHRAEFWARIATAYGSSASGEMLEQAWFASDMVSYMPGVHNAPPTPCVSPDGGNEAVYARVEGRQSPERERQASGISVSALLGIDASPRSPKERELIRLMEEGRRCSVGA